IDSRWLTRSFGPQRWGVHRVGFGHETASGNGDRRKCKRVMIRAELKRREPARNMVEAPKGTVVSPGRTTTVDDSYAAQRGALPAHVKADSGGVPRRKHETC